MNQRSMLIAIAVLAVLGGLAYVVRHPAAPAAPGTAFTPGQPVLRADLNAVRALEIVREGGTVRLESGEQGWTIASLHGYPASFEKIADNLRALARVKGVSLMRGGEQQLAEFGLDDAATERVRIRLLDADGQVLAVFDAGKERGMDPGGAMRPGGRYVRVGEGPVLLADDFPFSLPGDAQGWTDARLASVPAADVVEVEVRRADGEAYTLRRGADGQLVLADLAESEEMQAGQGQHVARALEYLSFSGVADPALSDADAGFEQPERYLARTRDGVLYTVLLGGAPESNRRYARLSAEFQPPPAPEPAPLAEDADDEARKAAEEAQRLRLEAHEREVAAAREKCDAFNRHCKGWTFLLQTYNADQMLTARSKLAATKEQPAAEQPDSVEQPSAQES